MGQEEQSFIGSEKWNYETTARRWKLLLGIDTQHDLIDMDCFPFDVFFFFFFSIGRPFFGWRLAQRTGGL